MPALKNPRHEAFAQSYVRGETAGNATGSYRKAFGKDDRKSAARCLRHDDVSQRIRELNAQVGALQAQATTKALERYEVTAERIIGELARMGFANMLDYIRVTDGGRPVVRSPVRAGCARKLCLTRELCLTRDRSQEQTTT